MAIPAAGAFFCYAVQDAIAPLSSTADHKARTAGLKVHVLLKDILLPRYHKQGRKFRPSFCLVWTLPRLRIKCKRDAERGIRHRLANREHPAHRASKHSISTSQYHLFNKCVKPRFPEEIAA
jgi:hypothetical protein